MQGVAGGVSAAPGLEAGQARVTNPDLLSASTTLQQAGGGGYARLVDALQSLDQAQNVLALVAQSAQDAADIAVLKGQVTTINGQIAAINGQIGTINTRLDQLANAILGLTSQLGGWTFGAVSPTVPSVASGSLPATEAGTQYLLPLYSA